MKRDSVHGIAITGLLVAADWVDDDRWVIVRRSRNGFFFLFPRSWKKGQAGINEPEATLAKGATDFGPFEEPKNEQTEIEIQRCKTCGGSLIPHSLSPKPSWANIMHSNYRPHWYTRC